MIYLVKLTVTSLVDVEVEARDMVEANRLALREFARDPMGRAQEVLGVEVLVTVEEREGGIVK
jgi:hypothetical protein